MVIPPPPSLPQCQVDLRLGHGVFILMSDLFELLLHVFAQVLDVLPHPLLAEFRGDLRPEIPDAGEVVALVFVVRVVDPALQFSVVLAGSLQAGFKMLLGWGHDGSSVMGYSCS